MARGFGRLCLVLLMVTVAPDWGSGLRQEAGGDQEAIPKGMVEVGRFVHPAGPVATWVDRILSFDPSGKVLAVAGGLSGPITVCTWTVGGQRLLTRTDCGRSGEPRFVLLSRGGRRLAFGCSTAAWVVDLASGRRLVTVNRPCAALWLSDDGRAMRTVSESGTWYEWNEGRPVTRRQVPNGRMNWGAFSRDGGRVVALRLVGASRSPDGYLLALRRGQSSCRTVTKFEPGSRFAELDAVPESGRAVIAEWWASEVAVFDTHTGARLRRYALNASPHGMAISPDGRRLAVGHSGRLIVTDMVTGAIRASAPVSQFASEICWSRDGHLLASTCGDGVTIVWQMR